MCVHCMETDHSSQKCALTPIPTSRYVNTPRGESIADLSAEENCPSKSLGVKVCYSWNDERCATCYCCYWHSCANVALLYTKRCIAVLIRWYGPLKL